MASSYNSILQGVETADTGDQVNTWNDTLLVPNTTNWCKAMHGYLSKTITGDTTLTDTQGGTSNDSENRTIVIAGSLGAAASLTIPSRHRRQAFYNTTGATVTVKTSGGTGVAIPTGFESDLYCDGTDVYGRPQYINGALRVSGTINGVTAGGASGYATEYDEVNSLIAAGGGTGAADGSVKMDAAATSVYLNAAITVSGGEITKTDNGDSMDLAVNSKPKGLAMAMAVGAL